jgi:ubiquinone/menaquinone biosynthesis C-methylase UbiE
MALPYEAKSVDHAVMALVIFFVPVPATGVAEMVRVTRSGGTVSAYAWNFPDGGFPYAAVLDALRAQGKTPLLPPQAAISTPEAMHALWTGAGLRDVQTTTIRVQRTFADFEDLWATALMGPLLVSALAEMSPEQVKAMQDQVRAALPTDAQGRITYEGWASAVKGVVG